MEKDFKYWLRWVAVLPGAAIAGVLMTFPLHWVLYFTLAHGETISGVNIEPIERNLAPFVRTITFILAGFEIAPHYKFKTSVALALLPIAYMSVIVILIHLSVLQWSVSLEPSGMLGLLGLFLGLYIAWRKSKLAPDS